MKRKHIIFAELFEFGGSNAHLKLLIEYLGPRNVLLIIEDPTQLKFIDTIDPARHLRVKVKTSIRDYADLQNRFTTNVKECYYLLRSLLGIQFLCIRNGFAKITVNAVKPEKYLYLLWLPFTKVNYILHTTPHNPLSTFTSYTCNTKLSENKRITTVSKSNKTSICEKWSVKENKRKYISVIYNCLGEKRSFGEPQSAGRSSVLTLGHVTSYKNPHIWLEVAKQVTQLRDDIQFIWLGNGPLYDYFQKEAAISERILFKGFVRETSSYFTEALMYYQPSLEETHGISVLEAMVNSLPCVVTNIGGLTESITDQSEGFVVDPNKVSEHVDAIIKLIDNPELCRRYGVNGRRKYLADFDYPAFKIKMDLIYA